MRKVGQSILAVVAGFLVASVGMGVAETMGHFAFPSKVAADPSQPVSLAEVVASTPPGAFGFILAGWFVGTFIGSSITAKLAPSRRLAHGIALGGILLGSAVANMATFPHPLWVRIVGVLLFLPAAFLGGSLGSNDAVPDRPA